MNDVIIIGGGPAGSTAGSYTARAGLKTLIIDRSIKDGALAMTPRVTNYPGIPGEIKGEELVQRIRNQAEEFGAKFIKAVALSANLDGEIKTAYTSEGDFLSRAIIISTGAMGRKHAIPGEVGFIGKGVSYCATCDAGFFKDEDVAVIGDSPYAIEEALFLTRFARHIYLLSGKKDIEEPETLIAHLSKAGSVEFLTEISVKEIKGDKNGVNSIITIGKGKEREIKVRGVFLYLKGNAPQTDFLKGQLKMDENGFIIVDSSMMTSTPGVFAIGDVVSNQLRQAIIAAADGARAAISVDRYLNKIGKVAPAKYY